MCIKKSLAVTVTMESLVEDGKNSRNEGEGIEQLAHQQGKGINPN